MLIFHCRSRIAIKRRYLAALTTANRRISSSSQKSPSNTIHYGKCEMDSHADTIVAGRNCVVLNYTGKECDVEMFSDSHDAIKNVPLAQVGTACQSAN